MYETNIRVPYLGTWCKLKKKNQNNSLTINFLKSEPIHYDPEVVEEGKRDDHGPVVTQPARGIEHERPVWPRAQATTRICRPPPETHSAAAANKTDTGNRQTDTWFIM